MVGDGTRSTSTRSVLIISEHTLIREGLKALLSDKPWGARQERASIESAIAEPVPNPALIVVACRLEKSQIEPLRLLRKTYPQARIVCYSSKVSLPQQSDLEIFGTLLDGCLLSCSSPDSLRLSLDLIMMGESVLPLSLFQDAGPDGQLGESGQRNPVDTDRFSLSERRVLSALATGKTNKAIARELDLAEATVKVYVKAIFRKIGVANRTQAAIWIAEQRRRLGEGTEEFRAPLDEEETDSV